MFDAKKQEDFTKKYLEFIKTTPVESLKFDEVETTYATLIQLVGYHNWLYYIKSAPTISDKQYDDFFTYIKNIERLHPAFISKNSPTQRLTYQLQSDFSQAHHKSPLLSLENSYNAQDLLARNESTKKLSQKTEIDAYSFLCQPKYDGVSVELIYQNGSLQQAITRGDGYIGEDVTANVKTILSTPIILKHNPTAIKTLRVRGEIVMTKKALERINEERKEQGESTFVNVRNAASGSIRQLDTSITAKRGLLLYVYEILELEHSDDYSFFENKKQLQTDTEARDWLEKQGFQVHQWHKHVQTIDEVIAICESTATKNFFDMQEIEFDGIVVKINELPIRTLLGATNHHPRRAMAYKFPTQQITTQLLSIDYQVGRTGVITPTANLQAVELGGVTISRASLHNFDYIKEKDIRIGDWVWLQRSGEVIPYVIASIDERRDGTEQIITIPTNCPVCNGPIAEGKSDIFVYCINPTCPAKLKEQLLYFASRDAVYIEGVGDALVQVLIDQGLVKTVADLYLLDQPQARLQLLSQAGIGQKKYLDLIEEIKKTKNAPLRRLLNGLGITHIGKKTAQLIVDAIQGVISNQDTFDSKTLEHYLCDEQFLLTIKGIGPEIITALKERFSNPTNQKILEQMTERGVNRNNFSTRTVIKGKLTGVHFCITGTFALPRKVIADILTKHGATVSDSLTKQTTFLIVGNDPSSKLQKAQNDNITTIEGLDRLEQKFDFLKNDIGSMQLFAKAKTPEKPRQEGLFG